MTTLVTGAAGFIGYHLAEKLSRVGDETVVCVDNGSRGQFDSLYESLTARPNVTRLDLDLNDPAAAADLPEDVDMIYHMAALNGTQNFYERPLEVVRSCTLPTLNLLAKYAPDSALRRFVFAGTSESYASIVTRFGWPVPTAEDVPLGIDDVFNPRWSYAAGKMHGEVATVAAAVNHGMDFSIIRYHNVYGPRMGDKHVVPDFLMRAKVGRLELFGHEDTRSFIYIDDAVRATLNIGTSSKTSKEIVNVGSEREITIRELGEHMKVAAGLEGEIVLHSSPNGSVRRRCPDISKLRSLVGFEEEWTLADGLRETARFYLAS